MNPLIELKKATPVFLVALVCFGLLSTTQAVSPAPNGGYPGSNTAVGQNALLSRTSGIYDTAIGTYSELLLTSGNFNTGVGAGTLLRNNANENTAVGAGALLTNSTGLNNTACGTFGLFSNQTGNFNNAVGANSLLLNVDGDSNNAFGESALSNNIHGDGNTAMGDFALTSNDVTGNGLGNFNTALGVAGLFSNRDGDSNIAVGFHALGSNTDGSRNNAMGFDAMAFNQHGTDNVAIGDSAGLTVEGSFNIYIGAFAGPSSSSGTVAESETIRIGDVSKVACYIGGIAGAPVTGVGVVVDPATGQLGVAAAGSPLSANELLEERRVVQELKATTERQAARIALQDGQIQALIASIRQQAEQIQKVSAQLETSKPAPQMVNNP